MLTPGTKLGSYEILSALGAGGMGEVYRARDPKLGREIAIKVLPSEMAGSAQRRERFEREAKAVAALNHPNIVTIYSIEESAGVHFITMELVRGKTLTDLIESKGLGLKRFFEIAVPVADAVSSAHGHGITHRDLKPDNRARRRSKCRQCQTFVSPAQSLHGGDGLRQKQDGTVTDAPPTGSVNRSRRFDPFWTELGVVLAPSLLLDFSPFTTSSRSSTRS